MATILQTTFSIEFSWKEILVFSAKFHLFGAKPSPEPKVTQFTDAYMRTSQLNFQLQKYASKCIYGFHRCVAN